VGYPWRRFLPATIVSGAIWATYAFAIGRIGGTTFANKPWIGLIVALGLALIVSLFAEVVRRILRWRRGGRTNAASAERGSRDVWTAFAGDQTGSHDANAADGDVRNVRLRPEGQRAAATRSPAGTAGQTHPQGAV
jgi:hypothetical protein